MTDYTGSGQEVTMLAVKDDIKERKKRAGRQGEGKGEKTGQGTVLKPDSKQ